MWSGALGEAGEMKIGIILPTFRDSADEALRVAEEAEAFGIDGVFCYDHLWPMGNPARPALAPFPILAAIALRHPRLFLGPLVARIGLVESDVLISQFAALEALSPGRVIAALGTGDKLSKAENDAYGIAFASPDERREALVYCISRLKRTVSTLWVGGGANATMKLAEEQRVAVNMWGATPEALVQQATRTEVTWAGILPQSDNQAEEHSNMQSHLMQVKEAGATWAVLGWPVSLESLGAIARDENESPVS
jgi:alkanesulfonate monooxygenase SsuD/methylene tetrahydromethanopterin reductase-like flavin-dependent oxidoreductase (luciferase family)